VATRSPWRVRPWHLRRWGRERLESLRTIRTETVGHTAIVEQSYRQEPFLTEYHQSHDMLDLAGQRLYREAQVTWPEADLGHSRNDYTLIVDSTGGVFRGRSADRPCSSADVKALRQMIALGPARLLLTALQSEDLHFDKPETIRSTRDLVLAFVWDKVPVRVLINPFTHLPDAVDTVQAFDDYWSYWGDVRQRVYFDNWMLIHGIVYPTSAVEERNGTIWQTLQAVNVEFNVALEDKQFAMDDQIARKGAGTKWFIAPFDGGKAVALAPGVDLFSGGWNASVIQQSDGLLLLEVPMSGEYTQGLVDTARRLHPGLPIKAVLSTSDSWPHTGGVRQSVANGLPLYVLDLNRPLLDRLVEAPHSIDPDALAKSGKRPDWRIVSGKTVIGQGENRVELYPLRGTGTQRQYMVYLPGRRILYASDTLVINSDGSLYDPELTFEVLQAVKREGLDVATVFAMHQAPVPWATVLALVAKAQRAD